MLSLGFGGGSICYISSGYCFEGEFADIGPLEGLAVDVEESGEHFDFVAQEVESDDAGEVGEVIIFDLAEGDGGAWGIEADGFGGG